VRPALPELGARAALSGSPGLTRLAVESWLDGCVAEGLAAEHAACAARLARAMARGGEAVRAAVRSARDEHSALNRPELPSGLEAHGCLAPRTIERLA